MRKEPGVVSSRAASAAIRMQGRGYGGSAALLPLGKRRSVPSKWEDAERWICSPVRPSDGVAAKTLEVARRRPKSKSGPLGPHCVGGADLCLSPSLMMATPDLDDGRAKTFTANSPTFGGSLLEYGGGSGMRGVRGRFEDVSGPGTPRVAGATVPAWTELLVEASLYSPTSQEEKLYMMQDCGRRILNIQKKDVGTQMSPQRCTSSPREESLASLYPSHSVAIGDLHKQFSGLDVRDVQVDDQITIKRWSKRHFPRGANKSLSHANQCQQRCSKSGVSSWKGAKTGKCMSKVETEEARIIAWENVQKAKAEAAIRELEMKLEKKRSSSMDKILNKLSLAQKKAEEMRKSITALEAQQADATSTKTILFRGMNKLHFLNGCFHGHAI